MDIIWLMSILILPQKTIEKELPPLWRLCCWGAAAMWPIEMPGWAVLRMDGVMCRRSESMYDYSLDNQRFIAFFHSTLATWSVSPTAATKVPSIAAKIEMDEMPSMAAIANRSCFPTPQLSVQP
jgi:hypothetical protein